MILFTIYIFFTMNVNDGDGRKNPVEHTCSLCTHGPTNTNESHDILEGKGQAVLNLDI